MILETYGYDVFREHFDKIKSYIQFFFYFYTWQNIKELIFYYMSPPFVKMLLILKEQFTLESDKNILKIFILNLDIIGI